MADLISQFHGFHFGKIVCWLHPPHPTSRLMVGTPLTENLGSAPDNGIIPQSLTVNETGVNGLLYLLSCRTVNLLKNYSWSLGNRYIFFSVHSNWKCLGCRVYFPVRSSFVSTEVKCSCFCLFLSRDMFVKVQSAFPRKESLSFTNTFSSSVYLFLEWWADGTDLEVDF